MSKSKNAGLDQYGAKAFEQQQFGTAGVERVNRSCSCLEIFVRIFLRGRFFCFIVFYYLLCMIVLRLWCLSGVIKNNNNSVEERQQTDTYTR